MDISDDRVQEASGHILSKNSIEPLFIKEAAAVISRVNPVLPIIPLSQPRHPRIPWRTVLAEPNCFLFYKTLQIKLEDIFISAKAAAGGFTEKVNRREGQVSTALEVLSDIFSLAPVIGNTLSVLLRLCLEKFFKRADEHHQTHVVTHISRFATIKELAELANNIARQLTYWYMPQLSKFRSPSACTQPVAKQSRCCYPPLQEPTTPAAVQRMAALVILWLVDALETYSFALDQPLSHQLVNIITIQKSMPDLLHANLVGQTLWKNLRGCRKELAKLLNSLTVYTSDNQPIFLPDLFTHSGVQTPAGKLYAGNGTQPALYGFCNGTYEAVRARGLYYIGRQETLNVDNG